MKEERRITGLPTLELLLSYVPKHPSRGSSEYSHLLAVCSGCDKCIANAADSIFAKMWTKIVEEFLS